MSSRKHFLVATASVSAALAASPIASRAQSGGAPQAPPSPAPSASATPTPSSAARAMAARIAHFDPTLTPKEIESIAAGIEQTYQLGDTLNPKGAVLKNSDAPLPGFDIPV